MTRNPWYGEWILEGTFLRVGSTGPAAAEVPCIQPNFCSWSENEADSQHHSERFPAMSQIPQSFGFFVPAGWIFP